VTDVPAALDLPPESLAEVFPFHVAIDAAGRIVQAGAVLRRVLADMAPGAAFADHFRIERPGIPLDFATIRRLSRSVFVVACRNSPLKLKGQMLPVEGRDVLLFLCSPWLTSLASLDQLGLSLNDFAVHDQVVDCLFLLQAQQSALADVRKLASTQSVKLAEQQAALLEAERVARERLEQEMGLARRIQTSMLPRRMDVPGLEIAARMVPATEVGGDYFDVLPTHDGGWLAVGDVSGHGLGSGLVMLMVQSAVSTLVREAPDLAPRDLVSTLNAVLYDNIRHRLGQDDFVTFSAMRYRTDGTVVFACAHEQFLHWHARERRLEEVPTPGSWLGAVADVRRFTLDSRVWLEPGDLLVLYTDGVTEAMDAAGEQFGLERLGAEVERLADAPTERICDHVLDMLRSWTATQDDDVTLLVARYRGE
jgi:serine phosphatase RsbU (regulator of sigma subunit)